MANYLKEKKLWDNEDLQDALEYVKKNNLQSKILENVGDYDKGAVSYCMKECYYEAFDRYDSDVCEQFIYAFKKAA